MVLLVGGNTYNKEEEGKGKGKEKDEEKKKNEEGKKKGGEQARAWSSALPSPFFFKLFEPTKFNKVWRLGLEACVVHGGLG
jgi:hypothetical protein